MLLRVLFSPSTGHTVTVVLATFLAVALAIGGIPYLAALTLCRLLLHEARLSRIVDIFRADTPYKCWVSQHVGVVCGHDRR
jgi:hypothetical protein